MGNHNYTFSILCTATDVRFRKLEARIARAALNYSLYCIKSGIVSIVEVYFSYSSFRSRQKRNINSYTSIR
jgi:hypothetical protein